MVTGTLKPADRGKEKHTASHTSVVTGAPCRSVKEEENG